MTVGLGSISPGRLFSGMFCMGCTLNVGWLRSLDGHVDQACFHVRQGYVGLGLCVSVA